MAEFMLVAFIIAVTVSIVLNSKKKINIGISAAAFAYILGCWVMKMTPAEVIKLTPSSIVFQLAVVAMLFSFPKQNGLMDVLCGKIIYMFRNGSYLLPYAIWLCYFLICFLGSGGLAAILIFGVISFRICDEAGLNPLIASVAGTATIPGSQMPWSNNGVITIGYMEPFFPEIAHTLDIKIALVTLVFSLLFLTFICIVTGAFKKRESITLQKPKQFSSVQKSNLTLIICIIVLAMLPSFLKILMPGNELIKLIATNAPALAIAPLFAVLAGLLTLFADGLTVIQLLIGIAGPVVLAMGINPLPVFSAIVITARFCASSPFSSAGAMLVGMVEESKRSRFFTDCIWVTFAELFLGALFIGVAQFVL